MPTRNKKPCTAPGYPELIGAGKTYCPSHSKKDRGYKNKVYDRQQRDPKLSRFYSSGRWRKTRNIYIQSNPLCERCMLQGETRKADVVDHIIPIKIDWQRKLDMSNLQSLCNRCHAVKTREDKEKYEQL